MRILGIDPGYATTGFGVLHSSQGQLHLLNYGTITTPAGLTLSRRLVMLYDDMMELLSTVKPRRGGGRGALLGAQRHDRYRCEPRQRRDSAGHRKIRARRFMSIRPIRSSRLSWATAARKSGRSWT